MLPQGIRFSRPMSFNYVVAQMAGNVVVVFFADEGISGDRNLAELVTKILYEYQSVSSKAREISVHWTS